MATADDARARAKLLYEQAQKTSDANERLGYVLQAIELEMKADALQRSRTDKAT